MPALKSLPRALFALASVAGVRDGSLVLALPNDAHRRRCGEHLKDVEAVLATVVGAQVKVTLVVDGSAARDDHDAHDDDHPSTAGAGNRVAPVVELHPGGAPTPDEDIDLDDLVDAPPESVVTPIERLAQAFPGSELLDERR